MDLRNVIQKRAAEATTGTIRWIAYAYAGGVDRLNRDVTGFPALAHFEVSSEDEKLFPKYCGFRNGQSVQRFDASHITGPSNEAAVKRTRKIIEVARKHNMKWERIFDVSTNQYETPEELLEALDRQARTASTEAVTAMASPDERWRRAKDGFGYISQDGKVFIERGAPMSGGGMAWLIWYRVADSEIDPDTVSGDGEMAYLRKGGMDPVRRGRALSDSLEPDRWYVHGHDAGSLYEAKDTGSRTVEDGKFDHG